MKSELIKFIMPSIQHRSIKSKNDFRVRMAVVQQRIYTKQKEANKAAGKEDIVKYISEFTRALGIKLPENFNNVYKLKKTPLRRIDYAKIKKETGIKDRNDIVWIKLNISGCISVVGTGCDIYFTEKTKKETSSGKINYYLNEKWNENEVLIFPLADMPDGLNRSDIESGIGNYLISKGVPILDYYSHNY